MSHPKLENDDLQDILELDEGRSKWPKRLMVIGAVLILALAGLWFFHPSGGDSSALRFRTAKVEQGRLEVLVSATGKLEPVNQVTISTEVSGTIREVRVDFNDTVKKGQVLAVLDTTKLAAQRDEAKAALALAKAQVKEARANAVEAKVNLGRLKKAFEISKGRLPSAQTLDAAQATHDKARAQVDVARAQVDKAASSLKATETDLAKAMVVAPIDGMVLDRQVEPGTTVAASLNAPTLFTLAETLTRMELSVAIDEADVGQVKEGQKATFVVDAYPEQRFKANITQVRFAPVTTDGVVTYSCILAVDNSNQLLRPGMTATADIVTIEVDNALLVPNTALRFTPAQPTASADKQDERSIVSRIMPRPSRGKRKQKESGKTLPSQGAKATIYLLVKGKPQPLVVTTGPSDGLKTQVISEQLQPGARVIIGQEAAGR